MSYILYVIFVSPVTCRGDGTCVSLFQRRRN